MAGKPPANMHPFLQEAIQTGQQVFAKALMSAFASALNDVSMAAREVDRRTSRAKKKIKAKYAIEIEDDEED